MGRHDPRNSRQALQERVDDLRNFLRGRLDDIRRVRHQRAQALGGYQAELREATQRRRRRKRTSALVVQSQKDVVETARGYAEELAWRLERAQQKLQDERRKLGDAQEAAELQQRVTAREIATVQERHAPLRRHWRDQLRAFQDGQTRRKRSQLSKLQRRLADKEKRAKQRKGSPTRPMDIMLGGLGPGLGTPKPQEA